MIVFAAAVILSEGRSPQPKDLRTGFLQALNEMPRSFDFASLRSG